MEHFQRENQRKIDQTLSSGSDCCRNQASKKNLVLPFKCSQCCYYYFDCNYIHPHIHCQKCKKHTCARCFIEKDTIGKLTSELIEINLLKKQLI